MSLVEKLFGSFSDRELKKVNPITKQVLALEPKYQAMSDADLQTQTAVFKQQLSEGKTLDDILPDAFAVCREAAWRVLGMKHFPVQVTGGIALHRGDIAEMQTGERPDRRRGAHCYRQRLSGQARQRVDGQALPLAGADRWPDRTGHGRRCPPGRLQCRYHLRHQQ